jgi:hypothetical protein
MEFSDAGEACSSGSGGDSAEKHKRQLAGDVSLNGSSGSYMNENEIVTEVLKSMWLDLRIQLMDAFHAHLDWLNSLGQNASRDTLTEGYGRLLETLTEI